MLDEFKRQLQLNNKSKNTIDTYYYRLKEYFCFSDFIIDQESLDNYILNCNKSNNTMNLFLNALKTYCKYNDIELKFPENRKKVKKLKSYMTSQDFTEIFLPLFPEIFNDYNKKKLIAKVLFYTGLRKSELCNLRREDIDLKNKTIHVKNTKNNLDRTVPIFETIKKDIEKYFRYHKEEQNAFNVTRYNIDYIFDVVQEYLKLNLKITPHSMRRSFARYCSEIGYSDTNIQCMLGHTNINQTAEYLQADKNSVMKQTFKLKV